MAIDLNDPTVLDAFEAAVEAVRAGRMAPEAFVPVRLQQGIYAQRQEGLHMVRVKLPGGAVAPRQLAGLAEGLERFCGHPVVNLTTRQDVQYHGVRLEDLPALLRLLAGHGLTTREAAGNTVRNVTACPLAGVCPGEHVDVQPLIEAVARRFTGDPVASALPRKFKVSFSGCEADCAGARIHDLGIVAVRRDGAPGFALYVGGGLGSRPREADLLDPFVPAARLLAAVEAVIRLHHEHSERRRRARARLKFTVERLGIERFRALYRERLARLEGGAVAAAWREPGPAPALPGGVVRAPVAQRQPGRVALPVAVPRGELDAAQLRGLAALLPEHGVEALRVTQDQNLLLLGVAEERLAALEAALGRLGLGRPRAGDGVVTCPGTTLCPLAVTASPHLADRIDGGAEDLRVRVNGCPNGCAQSRVGDIGLHGQGRRVDGVLVPCYVLEFGGDPAAGGGLAVEGPEVPARRVPQALARVRAAWRERRGEDESFGAWARREGAGFFHALLADLVPVRAEEAAALAVDWSGEGAVAQDEEGLGECAQGGLAGFELPTGT
ncbi:nitrite/sulfite reductase [Inmirania thermothiophila]|uniref:Sulfite reductase (NADPH) hemoprotein beta-component n=1 Tax=Inmirania thermothiophila TaxID=1750597 RepID=A0A3N1Y6D4_9GAMM|nr:nitrite/sulfite reductase [Inmirania thermothiophila]ROR34379.1 sulfite reductase (NADPH) hemoprotein beta-component [Inmirania thermothiophila]